MTPPYLRLNTLSCPRSCSEKTLPTDYYTRLFLVLTEESVGGRLTTVVHTGPVVAAEKHTLPAPCKLSCRRLHETEHGLLQLGIHFVCNGHHVEQHGAKIYSPKIVLDSTKDADLKDSRLFDGHGDSVTLLAPPIPVLACGGGVGKLGIWTEAEAADDVAEEERKMASALLIVQ